MKKQKVVNVDRAQRGAVLITSLIILLILTLIGVTAMQSSTLDTKIVGNQRNTDIAFQTAESCLSVAFAGSDTMTLSVTPITGTPGTIGAANAMGSYTYQSSFDSITSPPRGSGYSTIKFEAAHVNVNCSARQGSNATASNTARVDLALGMSQIIPKGN